MKTPSTAVPQENRPYDPVRIFRVTLVSYCLLQVVQVGVIFPAFFKVFTEHHQVQLEATFTLWGPILIATFLAVHLESIIQYKRRQKFPWELYSIFIYLGILLGISHFLLWFLIQPKMHQGSFGGDPYLNHLFMFSTAFLILGLVYLGLKKHLTERFRFGFQYVLLLQSAILAPYLLMAVLGIPAFLFDT